MSNYDSFPAISSRVIHRDMIQTVNAKDLYEYLQSKQIFSNWIQNRIKKYGFIEGEDFLITLLESTGGRPGKEYHLSIDMAKEFSMVENNDQGRKARRYFIQCEKKAITSYDITSIHVPQTRLEVIELMLEHEKEREQDKGQIQHLEDQHTIDAPKVAFCNKVIAAPDAISIGQAAKIFNTGRNRLYSDLRRLGWVNRRNEPYQSKIEAGYLDVKLGSFDHPDHGVKQSVTTLITGKGMVKLSNILGHPLLNDFKQRDFHAQLH